MKNSATAVAYVHTPVTRELLEFLTERLTFLRDNYCDGFG